MPETVIQGTIRILGTIHGGAAMNTIITLYEYPDDWEMKQFVSVEEMERYATENLLAIQPLPEN